ncbi:C-OmpA-like family protein CmpA [Legionella feeleii]|uniref:Outer membrane protein, OmpA family protein n=1 Tax=Legionella feeleii TaxID=453 RepID=A0A378IYC3_9GAMM|nr:C-OmpA-like family protein CmpA [Legionella feeleii]STX39491.1 outer membrane protein, OmpA family protein [Legionella feeleii]
MSHKSSLGRLAFVSLLTFALSGCFRPPYNNFKPYNRTYIPASQGALAGTVAVAAATGPVGVGTAAGAAVGALVGLNKESRRSVINELKKFDIQFVEYGDTLTLIVPTDRYFIFNSARFNELCYPGLYSIIKLIKMYPPHCPVYVAGFSDNAGSRDYKRKMSQARAETMLTFLWANDIPSQRLIAEGYGDKNPVADNHLVHGSAQNRRLEIQWFNNCSVAQAQPAPLIGVFK